MKTIKPQRLGVLSRTFENDQQAFFSLAILVFFRFDAPEDLLPEVALWKFLPEELGRDAIIDEAMPKQHAEFLVAGRAFAPGSHPVTTLPVRVQVGATAKELAIIGDREWRRGVPTQPAPFREMPITWERAFGGEGFQRNPAGKGATPVKAEAAEVHPLPNVEDPRRLINSPRARPEPLSLRPIDSTWPQRAAKLGTYDQKWLDERFPGFPRDLDWTFFNTAPADQWLPAYLQGGEPFVLENLHPEKRTLEGRVPEIRARGFITQRTGKGEAFRQLEMRPDTLWLFPHAERGVLVFHGALPVAEDDAADVLHLVVAAEALDRPRPVEHYQEVLRARLDKAASALIVLKDDDLLPPLAGKRPPMADDEITKIAASEGLLRANLRKKATREIEAARAYVAALGLDPDAHAPPPVPPEAPEPDLEQLPALLLKAEEEMKAGAAENQRQLAEREVALRALADKVGIDFDEIAKEWKQPVGGPPRFSAEAELRKLKQLATEVRAAGGDASEIDGYLADPAFTGRLVEGEKRMREGYRLTAHMQHPAARLQPAETAFIRAGIEASLLVGESLAGLDMTGADLSGMDLHDVDLSGSFLECANLANTNLAGAKLMNAVLARADLTNACLHRADLSGANLGASRLHGADLAEAVLTGAIGDKADFTGAGLRGARINDLTLTEATLAGADLREVQAAAHAFLQGDLSAVNLAGANLEKAIFLEVKAEGTDFSGANLTSATFLKVTAPGAVFRGARMDSCRTIEAAFEKADFRGARLAGANLRGARLAGADFGDCAMDGVDLSEADLTGARLVDARARGGRFVRARLTDADLTRADLLDAVVQKAHIEGTNFQDANLFRADFARVHGDARTRFKGANEKKVRVKPVSR